MMNRLDSGYFHRVSRETPTEFWINNPTLAEAEAALKAGAVGATTNPTYPTRLLKEEAGYMVGLIDKALADIHNDERVADTVYQQTVARLQRLFHPTYTRSNRRFGYVAIQGDPRMNADPEAIVEGAHRYRQMGENIIIKVPATPAGAKALEKLVAAEIPTIATLCFSVDQTVYMAEAYRHALERSKIRPICYVTFIAGILDTHLAETSARKGNIVPQESIQHAGCEASRVAYRIFKERSYRAILMGGGARGLHHFTDLVGGAMAITIGWNLAQRLIEIDGPIEFRINAETSAHILRTLEEHLPDFRKSIRPNSMTPEEFCDFGPVAGFQNTFLAGIDTLLRAIAERRAATGGTKKER